MYEATPYVDRLQAGLEKWLDKDPDASNVTLFQQELFEAKYTIDFLEKCMAAPSAVR